MAKTKSKDAAPDEESGNALSDKSTAWSDSKDITRIVKPLGPRVLVKLIPGADRSSGGLYLPPGARDALVETSYGKVVGVARAQENPSEDKDFGKNVSGVPEGAHILFPKGEGHPVPWDEQLRLVDVKHVLAVVEEINRAEAH